MKRKPLSPSVLLSCAVLLLVLFMSCSRAREEAQTLPPPGSKDGPADVVSLPPPPPHPVGPRTEAVKVGQVQGGVVGSPFSVSPPHQAKGVWPYRGDLKYEADFNTEEYGRITESGFRRVADHPLSTFAADVDRASYSNVRRFLAQGQLPPRDAVRIEELVNYFTYRYEEPRDGDPFSVAMELADCPWNGNHKLVRIGLQSKKVDMRELPPNNLVFLIDVSGSMMMPQKLPLVKQSLALLVDQLRPQDEVAIVVYAGSAGLVLPATSGANRAAIREAIERLEAGGSTAGGEGIRLAYRVAKENFLPGGNNRVILATDGDFNVGVTSDGELERLIESKRKEQIHLTVLGFGMGNIKDSKMELLANKGDGNYAYIDSLAEARKVLVEEVGATLVTVAKDVKLQVELNPQLVEAYRLIGYENRLLAAEDFNDDRKDAGEIGAGHSVTAFYEIVPRGVPFPGASVDPLKYQSRRETTQAQSGEMLTLKVRWKKPSEETSRLRDYPLVAGTSSFSRASDDFRFAAAVVQFGMLLRGSEHRGSSSWDSVAELAAAARGRDEEGYRRDFEQMVAQARSIAQRAAAD